ncbi:MAG: DUF1513 domain-containing protein [Pseudomonadales bacterium]
MMVINRRQFITATLTSIGSLTLNHNALASPPGKLKNKHTAALFLSAGDNAKGQHFIAAFALDGQQQFLLNVPHRAHDSCCSPDKSSAVFFSRRPGTQLYIVDLNEGNLIQTVNAKTGYHFYGHGVFSQDGRYLFTTENAYSFSDHNKSGIIGIYDTRNFQRIGEYFSGGIGPHQLALLNDETTLTIANGGILTHPDKQREKLNLDSMQSSLTYLDSSNGKIIDQFLPSQQHMSIRHLAVSNSDQVIVGVQHQGTQYPKTRYQQGSDNTTPLVLSHSGESQLQPMHADEDNWQALNQYIASIAIDNSGKLAISTSPRGNTVALWDLSTLQCLGTMPVRDVAGACYISGQQQFLISNGLGQVLMLPAQHDTLFATPAFSTRAIKWDNHLCLV